MSAFPSLKSILRSLLDRVQRRQLPVPVDTAGRERLQGLIAAAMANLDKTHETLTSAAAEAFEFADAVNKRHLNHVRKINARRQRQRNDAEDAGFAARFKSFLNIRSGEVEKYLASSDLREVMTAGRLALKAVMRVSMFQATGLRGNEIAEADWKALGKASQLESEAILLAINAIETYQRAYVNLGQAISRMRPGNDIDDEPQKPPRGGRKPLDANAENARLFVCDKWIKAKDAGVSKRSFCETERISVKTLDKYLDWRAKRIARRQN